VPAAIDRPRITSLPQQFADTVVARFQGRGSGRILLLAHMDTVYERGMLAQQPSRIDGDRAYGLCIADDKHGIAVILHALTMLKALSLGLAISRRIVEGHGGRIEVKSTEGRGTVFTFTLPFAKSVT